MKKLSVGLEKNTAIAQNVENRVMTAEERDILDWLSPKSFSGPQNSAVKSQTEGTGNWLLKDERYTRWRDSSAGLLWLHGVVGCGKTILCSIAIQDIQNHCRGDPSKKMAYWYFQFSDIDTQDACDMLQSLIRQLSSSPLSNSIRNLWKQHRLPGSKPSIKELMDTIGNIIEGSKQDMFIVIDALDEFPRSKRPELFDVLDQLCSRSDSTIHTLVTSRLEADISSRLSQIPNATIDIEHLVKGDIRLFVEAAIKEMQLCRTYEDLGTQILNKLTAVNETRFRWAELQIKRFINCWNREEIIIALNTIPETLEKTYEEALSKIPTKREASVRNVLMWLTSSLRPMTPEEIAEVALCENPDKLLEVLTSLLVTLIDEKDKKTIKLAHFSVKEYLIVTETANDTALWYRFRSERAHILIAETALSTLMNIEECKRIQGARTANSLLKYHAKYWPQHAVKVVHFDYKEAIELQGQINELFTSEQEFSAWLEIHDHDQAYGRDWSRTKKSSQPLYYASLLGLQMTTRMLLHNQSHYVTDIDAGCWKNPINAAAIKGNFEIVQLLLDHYSDGGNIIDLRLIAQHIEKEIGKTFELLLYKESGVLIHSLAVEAAAGNEGSVKEVMVLLLEKRGADVVITEEVVKAAAGNKNSGKDVMAVLLEKRGADVVITEEVVEAAAGNIFRSEEVMALLLEKRGADFVITEEVVKVIAARFSSDIMAVLLEKRGADVVITEEVVKAAAGNQHSGGKVMASS